MEGEHEWDVGENIYFEITVLDPNTGAGMTGQTAYITLTIQRTSDSFYWSGTTWTATYSTLTVTEVDDTTQPGRYNYRLSGLTGNISAERYFAHSNINNPPIFNSVDDYEVHVSRTTDVKVYESEPE